ncbi:endo alpha-1,4 polygalactosaminidase [Maribacter sp. 2-571]|uniref:endo alpha-1,4 polygalactosaminidase n=1 Tax=Maribacter sp. 2-571 TaxID=3417569 RepID=UPI003D356BC3
MRLTSLFYILLPLLAPARSSADVPEDKGLFIAYGKLDPEEIKGYDLLIVEPQHYTEAAIRDFKKYNKRVLGYLSLTEVHPSSESFQALRPFLIEENVHWGSRYINISDSNAQQILLQRAASILEQGFDGLFLDNLDNVSVWGRLTDKKGVLLQMVQSLNENHPNAFLAQNSGLFLADELRERTDAIIMESVVTEYRFDTKAYGFRKAAEKKRLVAAIKKAVSKGDRPVYLIEYADTAQMRNKVERELQRIGFPFFIANISLQDVPQFKKIKR